MIILAGIIALHFLVMLISKNSRKEEVPYISTFIITVIMVGYVFYMLINMENPIN